MAVHYLIDFENVREEGLAAVKSAQAGDTVYLIYTANAAKINLDAVAGVRAGLKIIKVAAGKQSLDMHLVSIMGFLLNAFGQDDAFVVVSNDNGFDGVVKFWKAEGYDTKCLKTVEGAHEEKRTQSTSGRNSNHGRRGTQGGRTRSEAGTAKSDDNNTAPVKEEQQAILKPEDTPEIIPMDSAISAEGTAAISEAENPIAEKNTEQEQVRRKENQKNEPMAISIPEKEDSALPTESQEVSMRTTNRGRRGRPNGKSRKASEDTKTVPVNNKSADVGETPETGNAVPVKKEQLLQAEARTALNNKLQSLLAEGGADGTIAGQVASIVLKNIGSRNYKQVIYRTITHKFGQKKGLEYYNLIKESI